MLAFAHRLRKPTAMLGQGLGPLQNKRLLRKASGGMRWLQVLGLREGRNSPALAAKLGVPADHVFVTGDDAIEPAYLLRPSSIGTLLGINVRATSYSSVQAPELRVLRGALSHLLAELKVQPTVIPISITGDEDARARWSDAVDERRGAEESEYEMAALVETYNTAFQKLFALMFNKIGDHAYDFIDRVVLRVSPETMPYLSGMNLVVNEARVDFDQLLTNLIASGSKDHDGVVHNVLNELLYGWIVEVREFGPEMENEVTRVAKSLGKS